LNFPAPSEGEKGEIKKRWTVSRMCEGDCPARQKYKYSKYRLLIC